MRWNQLLLPAMAAAVTAGKTSAEPKKESWQVRHMREEHGFDSFDPQAFFILHDSDNTRTWTREDILFLYGLTLDTQFGDGSGMGSVSQSKDITEEIRQKVVKTVLDLLDTDGDGIVSMDEWRHFCEQGKELPDFGFPGHHGDIEEEYERHHWIEEHLNKGDPDVKVVHEEDRVHEQLHHMAAHGDNGWEDHEVQAFFIPAYKVPKKFLKHDKKKGAGSQKGHKGH